MPKNEKNQGGCHTKRRRDMFQPSFSNAKCELLRPGQSGVLRISPSRKKLGFSVWKQSNHASKKRRALMKHSGGWLLFEQHLFVPKQWHYRRRCVSCRWLLFEHLLFVPKHVTLSQKIRLALLVSIPFALLTSSELLSCAHRADMSRDMLEKCQLVPVRIPSLFEQNVLKAVGRTQMRAVQKPMKGFTWPRSTGIDLPDMRERYLSRNVNIGERFAKDPRKTR